MGDFEAAKRADTVGRNVVTRICQELQTLLDQVDGPVTKQQARERRGKIDVEIEHFHRYVKRLEEVQNSLMWTCKEAELEDIFNDIWDYNEKIVKPVRVKIWPYRTSTEETQCASPSKEGSTSGEAAKLPQSCSSPPSPKSRCCK